MTILTHYQLPNNVIPSTYISIITTVVTNAFLLPPSTDNLKFVTTFLKTAIDDLPDLVDKKKYNHYLSFVSGNLTQTLKVHFLLFPVDVGVC